MFRVGQKVVCVDDEPNGIWTSQWVKSGSIYTISGIDRHPQSPGQKFKGQRYQLLELVGVLPPRGLSSLRFRPIQERKTDIGFAHEILRKATRKKPIAA